MLKNQIACLYYCEQKTVVVPLPGSAKVENGSSCGDSPYLLASFGDGHSLGLLFSRDIRLYRVANLSLSYNLSDNTTFPDSSSKGTEPQAHIIISYLYHHSLPVNG